MTTKEAQNTVLFTRAQRLNNECTHEQYYSQFVNEYILKTVNSRLSKDKIKAALQKGKNLNSIPLSTWDSIARNLYDVSSKMKLAGDYLTLSGGVCIAKQAARMLVSE